MTQARCIGCNDAVHPGPCEPPKSVGYQAAPLKDLIDHETRLVDRAKSEWDRREELTRKLNQTNVELGAVRALMFERLAEETDRLEKHRP